GKEVDEAMQLTCQALGARVVGFNLAPHGTTGEGGVAYQEWWGFLTNLHPHRLFRQPTFSGFTRGS
ncbi:MAG: hypothetical protein ACK5F6_09650, partial [Bacteroidota bacterium]